MSTTVLATKLFAPTPRPRSVVRERLLERLGATLDATNRLTVLSAPTGFGKTTLLTEWLSRLDHSAEPARWAWLSLDEGDNDLTRFLTHVVAALHEADLPVDEEVLAALDAAAMPDVLTAVVNEVTRSCARAPQTHRVLVLDDYHAIDTPLVHEATRFLLDHLPGRVHLVLATRYDPPLPLALLRGRGQLTEVRAADLRFTPAETRDFLLRTMGLALETTDVEALDERAEGWVAGLQLAALSLRGLADRGAVTDFIAAFTGSSRFVVDYLADEVLARQPGEVRDFLLRTALLDRLTGPLCDAITGRAGGAGMLADLDRGNLFLVPLDQHRSWYRYHHMFADVLRARLLADHPHEVPDLHRRASAWFSAHGQAGDAIRHALAAGDVDRAGYLVEAALPETRRARQDAVLLGWVRSLPEEVVRRSPVLSITAGWAVLMAGDLDAVDSRLDDAEAALTAGARDPALRAAWADTEDLRTAPATVSVYRASLAQARGDVAGTVRHARAALDLAGPDDHFVRGAGAGYLGLAAWAAGDVQQALSTFSEAVRSLHAAGNLVDELDATVVLADMWVAAGRPGRARRAYEQALHQATAGGEPYPRATADLHVGLAELDRERDDLAGAEAHLETARALAQRRSITENRHRWYVAMAQVRAVKRDFGTAYELLDQAEGLYRPGFYPDLRPIAALRARIQVAQGDLAAAEEWAQERGVTGAGDLTYLREYEHLTLVRLLLTRGHASSRRDALTLLDRLATAAGPERAGSRLEIGVLRALARHQGGERPQAAADLAHALGEAPEPEDRVRLLLDEGAPMVALLRDAAHASPPARRALERATAAAPPGDEPPPGPGGPLSHRELEVLRMLGSELTGPEIARTLYVTVNTLRTHTKRIFTKLDVTTRAAAVRRARERGLL